MSVYGGEPVWTSAAVEHILAAYRAEQARQYAAYAENLYSAMYARGMVAESPETDEIQLDAADKAVRGH